MERIRQITLSRLYYLCTPVKTTLEKRRDSAGWAAEDSADEAFQISDTKRSLDSCPGRECLVTELLTSLR
jgi:hypothetical protein